jgi:hypothetical protein
MHSNQSWPPVISPLGIHPCFRNATRAKQGCCRDWQGHTVFVSIVTVLGGEFLLSLRHTFRLIMALRSI